MLGASAVLALTGASSAGGELSFKSGIYTQAQADRGLRTYTHNCAACHGDMFNGSESGPPLSDGAFLDRWQTRSVADLYTKMRQTMPPPPDQPGKLSPQDYADIVAAVFSINEIPAGKHELSPDFERMNKIQMH